MTRAKTISALTTQHVATPLDIQRAQHRLEQAMEAQRKATINLISMRDLYDRALATYNEANAVAMAASHAVTLMIAEQIVDGDAPKAVSIGPRAIKLSDEPEVDA